MLFNKKDSEVATRINAFTDFIKNIPNMLNDIKEKCMALMASVQAFLNKLFNTEPELL